MHVFPGISADQSKSLKDGGGGGERERVGERKREQMNSRDGCKRESAQEKDASDGSTVKRE